MPIVGAFCIKQATNPATAGAENEVPLGEKQENKEVNYIHHFYGCETNSLKPSVFNTFANSQKQEVQIRTIDAFALEHKIDAIDFLKIDTEGYELNVLNGAERMLREKKIKLRD